MQRWTPLQIGLLVVALVVAGTVAVLAVMALEPDQVTCVRGADEEASDTDLPPEEVLAAFVAANDEQFPLDAWEVASTDGERTTFTNDAGGGHVVDVERGAVRSFETCD